LTLELYYSVIWIYISMQMLTLPKIQ
jgi:hypothetical protein